MFRDRAGEVELIIPFPSMVNEESWRDIWERSWFEASPESSWSHWYDSTVNAVTTAENRPAYGLINKRTKTERKTHKNQQIVELILPIRYSRCVSLRQLLIHGVPAWVLFLTK